MNEREPNNPNNVLDRAVADRLRKLSAMPVDLSRLTTAIEAQVPRPAAASATRRRLTWPRPLHAVAASVAVAGLAGILMLATAGRPATASAAELARVHQDLVADTTHGYS